MLFNLLVLILFITIVTLLVAAHELGHYLLARLFGMNVEEFAIGFGKKPLWTWMRRSYEVPLNPTQKSLVDMHTSGGGETEGNLALAPDAAPNPVSLTTTETTEFTIRPWPLGGFVRIRGMVPEDDGSEINVPGGFYSRAPWKRFIVLIAGPVFSILAGFAVLVPLFAISGVPRELNEPVLGMVAPNSAAAKAGLKDGDRILSIQGQPLLTFYDLISSVRDSAGKPLEFRYKRGGEEKVATVIPEDSGTPVPVRDRELKLTDELRRQGKIGVLPKQHRLRLGFVDATMEAVRMPFDMVVGLVNLFRQPSQFKEQVGGPISIVKATAATANSGAADLITFAGMLSIWLGIFNLLPVPPLDGGQMAIAVAEMLRGGRRLSLRVQSWVTTVGVALVALLFVSVFAIDIERWFLKSDEKKPAATQRSDGPKQVER